MANELQVLEFEPVLKQSGLDKAEVYAATFAPFMITIKELNEKTTGINRENPSPVDSKLSREVRLALVKNRTATDKQKDTSKAALLAEGNLIQNLRNVIVNTSTLIESELEAIEKHAENIEKAHIAALQSERAELLSPYVEDAGIFPLGTMTDDQFQTMLSGYKLDFEQKKAAAEKAEADRGAAEAAAKLEQERIRVENERLKAEAAEKEKQLEAERKEAARIQKEKDDAAAAKLKAEQEKADKERAEQQAIIDAQKKENDRIAKELAEKQAAEKAEANRQAKIEADRIAAENKAAKAPVKVKLETAINALTLDLPESEITADIMAKFAGFKTWALQQIQSL